MYDGHSDPKQFLMSYEATISSYGGNAAVMAKSFVMAGAEQIRTLADQSRESTERINQLVADLMDKANVSVGTSTIELILFLHNANTSDITSTIAITIKDIMIYLIKRYIITLIG